MTRRTRIPRQASKAQLTTLHGGTVETSKSPRTLKTYKSALKKYKEWCESQKINAEPSTFIQVNEYLSHLYSDGLAPSTITTASAAIVHEWRQWKKCSQIQRHLKQIVNDIYESGYLPIQAPPITWDDLVTMFQEELKPQRKGRGIESEEVARSRALRFFSQITIMYTCGGVRISESSAIEWNHIIPDEDGSGILILTKTKANPTTTRRRVIPVVMKIFDEYAATVPIERRSAGHQTARPFLHPNALTRKFQKHGHLLGKEASSHSCRRGSAYTLEDLHISTSEMQKLMGWKQASMVSYYTAKRFENPIVDAISADFDVGRLTVPAHSAQQVPRLQ